MLFTNKFIFKSTDLNTNEIATYSTRASGICKVTPVINYEMYAIHERV